MYGGSKIDRKLPQAPTGLDGGLTTTADESWLNRQVSVRIVIKYKCLYWCNTSKHLLRAVVKIESYKVEELMMNSVGSDE